MLKYPLKNGGQQLRHASGRSPVLHLPLQLYQQTACKAPVCWSKYTTHDNHYASLPRLFSHLMNHKKNLFIFDHLILHVELFYFFELRDVGAAVLVEWLSPSQFFFCWLAA